MELGGIQEELGGMADVIIWQMVNVKYGGKFIHTPYVHFRLNQASVGMKQISTIHAELKLWATTCRILATDPIKKIAPPDYVSALLHEAMDVILSRWDFKTDKRLTMRTERMAARLAKVKIPQRLSLTLLRAFYLKPANFLRKQRIPFLRATALKYLREEFTNAHLPFPEKMDEIFGEVCYSKMP